MRVKFREPNGPGADFYEQFQYGKNPACIIITLIGSAKFCDQNYKQIIHAIGALKPTIIQDIRS